MNAIILKSIQQSKVLELRYHNYSRTVEPHAYGRDKMGEEILRCYQTSGGSESGEQVGWKLLKVRETFSVDLSVISFSSRLGYKRNDQAMEYIFDQL